MDRRRAKTHRTEQHCQPMGSNRNLQNIPPNATGYSFFSSTDKAFSKTQHVPEAFNKHEQIKETENHTT